MSKRLSFRGILDAGLEDKIKLATKDGKTGYQIKKFQIIMEEQGAANYETVVHIYSTANNAAGTTIDFSQGDLLAVAYIEDNDVYNYPISQVIIFGNEIFNQDIYVNTASLTGTVRVNYYIELEAFPLTDLESTKLTLQSLRTISSR